MRGMEEISHAIASSVNQVMEEGGWTLPSSFFLLSFSPLPPIHMILVLSLLSLDPALEPLRCAWVVGDSHVISKSLSCGGWIVA